MRLRIRLSFIIHKWLLRSYKYRCRHFCFLCKYKNECDSYESFENEWLLEHLD